MIEIIKEFPVELFIVAVIIIFQVSYFRANRRKRKVLKGIFPTDFDNNLSIEKNEEGITTISASETVSDTFKKDIVAPINAYLEKNKGATDYHIIKEISDRTCDKIQEEVDSYNPIPLYFGLCGTMLGIICGIFFLFKEGGLDSLLPSAASASTSNGDAASQGIQHLLGGVAVAMIASAAGVLLTISGTKDTKVAVSTNEEGRNRFLSWIQSNLLPKMSSDVVSTLGVLYSNLNEFNSTFTQNSRELRSAFEAIQEAYKGQTKYTKELNKLDITKAQTAFAALGSATEKINDLNSFLKESSQYLASVVALTERLDTADSRTKAIERMGLFFESEIEQISVRKALLSETVGKIDLNLQQSIKGLQESSSSEMAKLQEHLNKVYLDFQLAIEDQQQLLEKKLTESSLYLEQFRRLETIEAILNKLVTSEEFVSKENAKIEKLNAQVEKLERLETAINNLTQLMSKQQTVTQAPMYDYQPTQDVRVKVNLPIPRWLAFITCGVLIIAGLFSIVYPLLIKFHLING